MIVFEKIKENMEMKDLIAALGIAYMNGANDEKAGKTNVARFEEIKAIQFSQKVEYEDIDLDVEVEHED